MDLNSKIAALITPTLEDMGYELVRALLLGGRRQTLQIMAERADGAPMRVDDCADISHAISALLDVEDPISDAYDLEVSSPGIDRPLTRLKDFTRWAGFDARVEADSLIDGRRRFSGLLVGLDEDDNVIIRCEDEVDRAIPFANIAKAKLLMTDALVAAVSHSGEGEGGALDDQAGPGDDLEVETETDGGDGDGEPPPPPHRPH